jgi:hypothetical protein
VSFELCCFGRALELLPETESVRVRDVPLRDADESADFAAFLPLTASCSWLPCLPLGVAESEPHCLPCFFIEVSAVALLC